MTPLAGRTAVVTGASRGIGAACAEALESAGARVAGLARSHAPERSDTRWRLVCDVTDAPGVRRAAEEIVAAWGVPDLLVNNAGTFLLRPFEETTPGDLAGQLAGNLQAGFLVAQSFLPAMRQRRTGRLITMGSVADHQAFPGNAAYAASKYGLRGLHETLRVEYRGTGVHCTLVSPGPTDTRLWDTVDPQRTADLPSRSAMLRPADVADAVVFVATRPAHVDIDWLRLGPA